MSESLPTSMKAAGVTGPRMAALVDVPFNASPLAPNEVAGRTIVSLISPGTEVNSAYLNGPGDSGPAIGGYAAVFEVTQVGSGVTDVAIGTRLFAMGSHAAWQRHPRTGCIALPPGLAPADAVFARLSGVSWSTLSTTRARPPARVLVTGLGPVGNLASQLFQAVGYSVTAVDPVESRRVIAIASGLKDVRATAPAGDEVKGLRGYHLAIDCSGHEQAVLDGCKAVRRGGEVVLVGVPWKRRTDILAHEILNTVFFNYVTLRSGWEWEVPREDREFATANIQTNLTGALYYIAGGRIRVGELGEARSPADAAAVYEAMANQTGARLSVVFDWARV